MDPMTQSAQISSSQGFADGQNSAAKESKLSDSFLSSSPVSLIQSPQGSFSPSSFGGEAEPLDGQPDSPIKTSPVSERIKALEALAAKKREPDFRSDGSFTHFRDRHHEKSPPETSKPPPETSKPPPETSKPPPETSKSPTEKTLPVTLKMGSSVDQESPESPFELLGDLRQTNELEETEEWMKAHLPPVLPFDAVDLIKGADGVPLKETSMGAPDATAAFAGVPDAFMDPPVGASELKDESSGPNKQPGAEEEFDVSFLPTAYMWDQPEKPSDLDSVISSSPAPPADFASPSPPPSPPACADVKLNVSEEAKPSWIEDLEQPQTSEVDSSGESDDTVIEDGVSAPASSNPPDSNDPTSDPLSTATDASAAEVVTPPPKSERKLMQVPTINVIETDEPNYSEEEMEIEPEVEEDDYIAKDPVRDAPESPEPEGSATETPQTRPLETEFMEGYSPPSSPVDSDLESSPIHAIAKCVPETGHEQPASECGSRPEAALSVVSPSESTLNEESHDLSSFLVRNEEVAFPDNDDEWADEVLDTPVKPGKADPSSKDLAPDGQAKVDEKSSTAGKEAFMERSPVSITSFMQDDIYDRQSFDYDYDISSSLDHADRGLSSAKERFLSDPSRDDVAKDRSYLDSATSLNNNEDSSKSSQEECPQNPYSCFQAESLSSSKEQEFIKNTSKNTAGDGMQDDDTGPSPKGCSDVQQETKAGLNASDTRSSPDRVSSDASLSEPADSFVEFMRECLKSRQDEEPGNMHQTASSKDEMSKTVFPSSHVSPSLVMDLEQEKLTISALKELGGSEDEECVKIQSRVPDQNQSSASTTAVPSPPCPQSGRVFDGTYSQEVEVIDEWVAEAYHLAEHVLTAILTHLSVKDLIHWRDPKKSGVVFGLSMLLLLSLAAFSVISVASYLLLSLLCVTITFRIYKSVVQAVQKSTEGHPFKALIDKDVSIPPETFRKHVDTSLTYINRALKQMSRLFLVEDLVDSLKLAVVMWLLTYVGAVFNGITILILADILLFAVPPIYEKNKTQIDQYIDLVRTQVNTTIAKLQEKLPGAVKRSKTE